MAKLWESKRYMTLLYVTQRMTPEEIAKKLNTSHMTIYRWLHKHGLIRK